MPALDDLMKSCLEQCSIAYRAALAPGFSVPAISPDRARTDDWIKPTRRGSGTPFF